MIHIGILADMELRGYPIYKNSISGHTFRHSFATHLLQTGRDIRTTQIYTHVIGQHFAGTFSPLDELAQ